MGQGGPRCVVQGSLLSRSASHVSTSSEGQSFVVGQLARPAGVSCLAHREARDALQQPAHPRQEHAGPVPSGLPCPATGLHACRVPTGRGNGGSHLRAGRARGGRVRRGREQRGASSRSRMSFSSYTLPKVIFHKSPLSLSRQSAFSFAAPLSRALQTWTPGAVGAPTQDRRRGQGEGAGRKCAPPLGGAGSEVEALPQVPCRCPAGLANAHPLWDPRPRGGEKSLI